ncbi:MAG: tRNA pseudouridine(13) synthase TruD [Pseudomonadota bacterium]
MSVSFPTVASPSLVSALLRAQPEDFVVSEELGFPLTGSGEHVWLRVRKRGLNTDQVAGHLARCAGLSRRDVSYSGMKDRHAVTEQWFSAWLPRTEVADWQGGMPEGVEVLEATRHSRKLQRGAHRSNRFIITLRECAGDAALTEQRLAEIARGGVPNYFGEQRFGRDGDNVVHAEAMFTGQEEVRDKHRRGIYLSAARSYLFNQVLARRVIDGNWNRILPGEALMLDGKNSFFLMDATDSTLQERLERRDIHPSGPLWGEGELPSRGEARALEEGIVSEHRPLADGLAAAGLRQERRALRLIPAGLSHQWLDPATLRLEFSLPRGCYATTVLREVANYRNAAGQSGAGDSGD